MQNDTTQFEQRKRDHIELALMQANQNNNSLFRNLGIVQLIDTPHSDTQCLIDALRAQALIIHCNPLQECIQKETVCL